MEPLSPKEKGSLIAIFVETLDNPPAFANFLDNPFDKLMEKGLTLDEVSNVGDFLAQFRDELVAKLSTPTDFWPLA